MFINVTDLGGEVLHFDRELRIEDDAGSRDELVVVESVRLAGTAREGDRGVALNARLVASIATLCSRCTERFSSPMDESFELTVVRSLPAARPGEVELDEDDLDLLEVPDGKVDLQSIAREQIYLNLPLKPICRPDCQGLCVTCGENRNRIECGCSREELDPRLAPLLEFKNRMGDD